MKRFEPQKLDNEDFMKTIKRADTIRTIIKIILIVLSILLSPTGIPEVILLWIILKKVNKMYDDRF